MKRFARVIIGIAILLAGVAISLLLWVTRPQAEKKTVVETFPVVEVQAVHYQPEAFDIPSQGIVEASRRSSLAAEVPGKVTEVNPLFHTGNRVDEGTWLVRIDPTDYHAARALAAANLADAKAALVSEEARVEQAERDWRKIGSGGEASDLTLRGPQLRGAQAQAQSAEAALEKAEADVRRTEIVAPFDCVIASTRTEVGSYLTTAAPVAEVFETNYEVRLPLSVDQLQFLTLDGKGNPVGDLEIMATVGGTTNRYTARIVRTEGEIDRSSRSAYLIAEVKAGEGGAMGLQPGLFVKASIRGRTIPHLARIPFSAFVGLDQVAIVAPDNTLQFREVTVVFRDEDAVYISDGLEENDLVSLTELSAMIKGQKVAPKRAVPEGPAAEVEPAPKPTP